MKIEPRHIRFLTPLPWPTRRRVILHGRDNTMHLLETALVIEGHRQRLFFPLVDRFFRLALSEWTTITVPYSRIVRFAHRRMLLMRVLALLLVWGLTALALVAMCLHWVESGRLPTDWLMGLVVILGSAGLGTGLFLYLLRARYLLTYRQADGKRAQVVFRISSRQRQKAFVALLERHRQTAGKRIAPGRQAYAGEGRR